MNDSKSSPTTLHQPVEQGGGATLRSSSSSSRNYHDEDNHGHYNRQYPHISPEQHSYGDTTSRLEDPITKPVLLDPSFDYEGHHANQHAHFDHNAYDDELDSHNDSLDYVTPLEELVLQVIEEGEDGASTSTATPRVTVTPARLATSLGLSIEDATAELCGLMAAVGGGTDGATFTFQRIQPGATDSPQLSARLPPSPPIMIVTFPKDVRKRAKRYRQQQQWKRRWHTLGMILIKTLQVIVALGLLLSLLIVSIAIVVSLVAMLIALSRSGGSNHQQQHYRNTVMRYLRSLAFALRQLLWCFVVFNNGGGGAVGMEGQDPFLRQVASDVSLLCSVCYGSPWSIWYWMQMRRHVAQSAPHYADRAAELVALYRGGGRTGGWGRDDSDYISEGSHRPDQPHDSPGYSVSSERGLLSVVVEFLFGPTPFTPGPTVVQRWKLRAAVIVELSTIAATNNKSESVGVALAQLAPYADHPPASLEDVPQVVQAGLHCVAHFHGIPSRSNSSNDNSTLLSTSSQARFDFPELLAESSVTKGFLELTADSYDGEDSILSLLYEKKSDSTVLPSINLATAAAHSAVPAYLQEHPYRLTTLTQRQFGMCVLLGLANLLGVLWIKHSITAGRGSLHTILIHNHLLDVVLSHLLCPVLLFYAVLFWILPLSRLALVLLWNMQRQRRNHRRQALARALKKFQEEAP